MAISVSLRCKVWIEAGWKCFYCGCDLVVEDPGKDTDFGPQFNPGQIDRFATIDHVVPQQQDGTDDPSNLVAACMACNRRKRAKSLEAFRYACWEASAPCRAVAGMIDACEAIGGLFPDGVPEHVKAIFNPAYDYAKSVPGAESPADFKFYGEKHRAVVRQCPALDDPACASGVVQ